MTEHQTSTSDPASLDPKDLDYCLLSEDLQRRNSLIYIAVWAAIYFIAPVSYVGILHADIIKSFAGSDWMANLPAAVNAWVLPTPVILAWCLTSTKYLRPMLVGSYLSLSAIGFAVAALFLIPSDKLLFGALVVHAGLAGIIGGVLTMCLWELLSSGMSVRRRGITLSLAFGIGPMFAVLGSFGSDVILTGKFLHWHLMEPIPRPWNYMVIFGTSGPVMLMMAFASMGVTIPARDEKEEHVSFQGTLTGIGVYLGNPLILIALFGFLLTYAGCSYIMPNLGLYMKDVTGEAPETYTGIKMGMRFGCKCIFGFLLGILMVRFNPKVPLLVTTGTCIVGLIWALFVPGKWYIAAFGFLGAGELFYLYYMNYIVMFARGAAIRQYSAYTSLFPMVLGFVAMLYGNVSDNFGYRASFWIALGFLVMAMVAVVKALPNNPPQPTEPEAG